MATKNVTLKVKVSQVTSTPASLAFGEMAYSTASNTLFIGDPTSTPIAVGGSADHMKLSGIASGAQPGTVTSIAGTGAITVGGTATDPVVAISAATTGSAGSMSATDKTKLDGIASGAQVGTVTNVSGSGPISVSNGTSTPGISISDATISASGTMSGADKTKLDGVEAGAQVNVVLSVAAKTGNVTLVVADVSGAAPLASPTFTGVVTVPAPTNPTDAASKGYVDSVALGLDFKESVVAASTANVTISTDITNGSVIDGITLVTGDRVLLKNQNTASENGIYVAVASGAASRATDTDSDAEVSKGLFVYVESGTGNGGSAWVLSGKTGALNTGALAFTQFGAGAGYSAGTGITITGSVLSVTGYSTIMFDGDILDGGSF